MCPQNPYSASKVAQDVFLRSIQHTFGLKLKFIRLSNQFGPYQHTEKMLPATILRALKGESIKIYGEGKNIRQWCPVTSSVKIISDVLFDSISPTAKDKLLNNNEVVAIWSKILAEKHGIKTSILYVPDRLGHDLMYALKTNKIVDEYYKTPLIEEFETTIKHYIDNKEYYN
jgi:dTDP-glucose 4,6-dehydratase